MIGNQGAKSRRQFFSIASGGAAALIVGSTAASATPEQVAAEIKKVLGDKKPSEAKLKLDLPSIAENGLVVPLGFEVESPMTDKDYIKAVHLFAEGNPVPQIATFRFSPMSPKAAASIRVRLAQSQNIIAIAETSSGEFYTARKEVKVTIGGCGG